MIVHTPDWVKRAVFYQIYPDRFARGQRMRQIPGIQLREWGAQPALQGFQGGDLYGVAEKLDYLTDLGINAIYLNPIFSSASNHRYHTFDYMQVDPLLGGEPALRFLLDEAHARGMYVILDGVFNHASRGFWPFHHILECGNASPYLDWFLISDWPLNPYPREVGEALNYSAWWGLPALPKLNVKNPGVREYLLSVARHWIDFGIDGWRLDVPEEIDDVLFWQDFRRTVREGNPEAYIVGEIWHDATAWLQGDRFDAVMNYVFSRSALGFFGAHTLRTDYRPGGYQMEPFTAGQFARRIDAMIALHHPEVTHAQLNLLDSHDTPRALWFLDGDESALRLSILFQMTMPGAPCIYYGTEIGMTGGPDPDCRGAFLWDQPGTWNLDLRDFTRSAIALRNANPVLSLGDHRSLYHRNGVYAFQRDLGTESAVVVFSTLDHASTITLETAEPDGAHYAAIWGEGEYSVHDGALAHLRIPARSGVVLRRLA